MTGLKPATGLELFKPDRKGGIGTSLIWFVSFVLFVTSVGIPVYLFDRERRDREAAAQRKREEAEARERTERARRQEIEASLRSQGSATSAIHGPNSNNNPALLGPASGGPRSAYDYLPPEQRRMIDAGRGLSTAPPAASLPVRGRESP